MHDDLSSILKHKGSTVHAVEPTGSVEEAVQKMNQLRIGALMVLDGHRPVGIFTERDVLVRVVAAGRDPRATRVSEVMTGDLVAARPSTSVSDAMVVVTEKRCRHLPVMEGDELVGMVSIGDLTRWVVRHQRRRIEDLVSYITGGYTP